MGYQNPFANMGNSAPSGGGGGYQNPFAGMPSTNLPAGMSHPNFTLSSIPAPSASSTPSASSGGGGGLGSWLGNIAGDAWHGIEGLYDRAKAGLEGAATYNLNNDGSTNLADAIPTLINPFAGPILGIMGGADNPTAAHQKYDTIKGQINQGIQSSAQPNWAKGLEQFGSNFALDTATDPLTYVPFGKVAEAAKVPEAFKAIKSAIGATETGKKVGAVSDYVFKPIGGARQSFVNSVAKMNGKIQSGANTAKQQVLDIFKGTTPEQRTALTHAMESTAPGTTLADPTLEALRQKVEPLLERATKQAQDKGLITNTINPEEYGVGRYIPHVSASKLDENALPFSDVSKRNPNVDAGKSRALTGTIQAINAGKNSPTFETDMAKILGYHLGQMNKASAYRDLISEAMKNGLGTDAVHAGEWFPGMSQKAMEYTAHDGTSTMLPESEKRYLEGLYQSPSTGAKVMQNGYRGLVNGLNKLMFISSPLIHPVNNLGTQTLLHDPGVFAKMPKYFKEAFTGVQPGSEMDKALQSGAMHLTSEIGKSTSGKDLANDIAKSLDGNGPSAPRRWMQAYNQFTPNSEKAYRAAAFERATQDKGMSPEEASNWVRSIYGGSAAHDATSKAEQVMHTMMPFFNWTKTAIGSNVKNMANNPAPYSALYHAMDTTNRQNTGHGLLDNANPLAVGLPWNGQGKQSFYEPYLSALEPFKLGEKVSSEGIKGIPDYAFTRTNPLVKIFGQALTGKQNPTAPVNNQYNVVPYPYLPSGSQPNQRGIFFGDKGPKVGPWQAQTLQDISNPFATMYEMSQNPGNAFLTNLLGGTMSTPNPNAQQREQNYANNQAKSELKSWMKKQAQGSR